MSLTRFFYIFTGTELVRGRDRWVGERWVAPGRLSGGDLSVTPRWIDSSAAVVLESGSMEWIFMARQGRKKNCVRTHPGP